jgi:hypothetical protein
LLAFCGPGQPAAPISAANMEWMQAANAVLFRLRLDRAADLPASELADIDHALLTLLEQATPDVTVPDKSSIATLQSCLQQLELAGDHIALASHALLQHQAEPAPDDAATLLLTQLISLREDSGYPVIASASHGDGYFAHVAALLRRAARDYQLGRLLNGFSSVTNTVVIEAPLDLLESTDHPGLTPASWHAFSAEAWTVLKPLLQVDTKAAETLRESLRAYGAAGAELVTLISQLQSPWQAYHRACWSRDFAEPASILQRIQLRACRLDSLLAGMIFSQTPMSAAAPLVQPVMTAGTG